MFSSYGNSQDGCFASYHNSVEKWHPNSSKFERVNCVNFASDAIREAEELRVKIRGKRILEAA